MNNESPPARPNEVANAIGESEEAPKNSESSANANADHPVPAESVQNSLEGHGRLAHSVYQTAINIEIQFDQAASGDACPTECGGYLYRIKPGIMISITDNALATLRRYHLEKLRCGLCGVVLTASLSPGMPTKKYDSAFKALLALQKYYVAVPFYCQEQVQRLLGFPLPDATQFE